MRDAVRMELLPSLHGLGLGPVGIVGGRLTAHLHGHLRLQRLAGVGVLGLRRAHLRLGNRDRRQRCITLGGL